VPLRLSARHLPTRLATGAYVLHAGIEKWGGSPERAAGMHGMAAGAFPVLGKLAPTTFLRLLAVAEITTGVALLVPVVPNAMAGAPLTAFSAALTAMYLRTPPCTSHAASGPPQPASASARTSGCSASASASLLTAPPTTPRLPEPGVNR
jgi:hypothetical protein